MSVNINLIVFVPASVGVNFNLAEPEFKSAVNVPKSESVLTIAYVVKYAFVAFPINNIANSVLKVTVGLQQSEKKMTFDDVLKQGQFGGMVKLAQDESDTRGLRYFN